MGSDIVRLCTAWSRQRLILGGTSMGAAATLYAALEMMHESDRSSIAGLILATPPTCYEQRAKFVPMRSPELHLTCFHASFFPFCPLCWPPLFLPFSRHILALFSPSKTALFCRAKGTAQSLERGRSGMDLSTKFGKEIPSRNLRKKRSGIVLQFRDNMFAAPLI